MTLSRRFAGLLLLLSLGLTPPARAQSPAALRTAQIQVARGDYTAAAAGLETVAPEALSAEGAYLLGRCYQALLQYDRAVAAFERADTSKIAVLTEWGRSLERLGHPDEAEARYRAAYRQDSTNHTVAANLARLLSDRQAWDEVAAIYERLLKDDTENSYLHAQLGTAYARLDSTDQAIIHYERAHALNLCNIKVVLALTKVYYDIEYYTSARRVLDRALNERPRHAALWRRSGEIALKEETYELAVEAFGYALQYSPDTLALDLSKLGASYYLLGDFDSARTALQQSFDLDDQDAMTAFYLGMAYQQGQHYDDALTYLNYAADLLGDGLLSDIHARIGNTYDQMDQHGEAIQSYRLSLNLQPDRTEVLFHLAALYDEYYADKATALEQYQRFLEQVEEDQLTQMQRYAQRRVNEIREQQFFEQGRLPESALDSITVQPSDSARAKGQE
ncbi:MAG: tetratricopeptide repeat protein [Rhodothermales bacterium]